MQFEASLVEFADTLILPHTASMVSFPADFALESTSSKLYCNEPLEEHKHVVAKDSLNS